MRTFCSGDIVISYDRDVIYLMGVLYNDGYIMRYHDSGIIL